MPLILGIVVISLTKVLRQRPLFAAFMGGISFSGVAIVSRTINVHLDLMSIVTNPLSWALVVYALIGLALFSMALQNALVTHVDATTYVVEIIIPTLIGLLFLGDHPRPGTAPLMYSGLLIVVFAIIALAVSYRMTLQPSKVIPNRRRKPIKKR